MGLGGEGKGSFQFYYKLRINIIPIADGREGREGVEKKEA